METPRPVPARRRDPALQNFIYKSYSDEASRRKDQELVLRIADRIRKGQSPFKDDDSGR